MDNNDKNKRNRDGLGRKISGFFGGKGFYIALFMCVALVGVYAWALLFEGRPNAQTGSGTGGYLYAGTDIDLDESTVPVGSFGTSFILNNSDLPDRDSDSSTDSNNHTTDGEGKPASAGADNDSAIPVSVPTLPEPDYYVWPVSGEILRGFATEALSYDVTMGDWRVHGGIDIAAQMGSKVYAVADGTVESIDEDDMLGTVVTIAHGGGIRSIYANLGTVPTVNVGDSVTAGTVIGSVSDSALGEIAQASHLHFAMMQDGYQVDPTAYLPEK